MFAQDPCILARHLGNAEIGSEQAKWDPDQGQVRRERQSWFDIAAPPVEWWQEAVWPRRIPTFHQTILPSDAMRCDAMG